jgi:transposase
MAPNLSKRERDRIDEALRDNPNVDMRELAYLFQTTYSTIQKRRATIRLQQEPGYVRNRGGRPSIITDEIRHYMAALIKRDPTFYLDEMADFIFMEFGVMLDNPRVLRLLKSLETTYKRLSVRAA